MSGLVPARKHERMTQDLHNPPGGLALVGFVLMLERVLVAMGMYEGWMTGPQQGRCFTTYVSLRPLVDAAPHFNSGNLYFSWLCSSTDLDR